MRYQRLDPLDINMEHVQDTTVAVVGLGATGSHMAETLARLGADLVLIDRDYLEEHNLATSALYTEDHVEQRLPKAAAAQNVVQRIATDSSVTAHIADVNSRTIHGLLDNTDLVLDGTDNMETRFLLNEYSVHTGTPWIHVSALGYAGEVMPIIPQKQVPRSGDGRRPSDYQDVQSERRSSSRSHGERCDPPESSGACFHCVFGGMDGSQLETCETTGILQETAATAAHLATTTAVKHLSGNAVSGLTRFNLQTPQMRTLAVDRQDACTVCHDRHFPQLDREVETTTTALCGEQTYQVNPHREEDIDLASVADRLQDRGAVTQNDHLLRFESDEVSFTLFTDGRAIIDAENTETAKSIYARFVGS